MANKIKIIDLTPKNISDYGLCGYKDVSKHKELRNKIDWLSKYYDRGLRIKAALSEEDEYLGMLEYIPGEFAHRPVNAGTYLFIHCIFVGFRKEFKGKGYASQLIESCILEAKALNLKGVAVVTRKGSFMSDNKIFFKNGFDLVDKAKPDFDLLVYKFNTKSENPSFKKEILEDLSVYADGLTIIRSIQCPYTEKNVKAIIDTAKKKFGLETNLIDANNHELAQQTPCPFGTFCMIYGGKVISYHPISNTRFENIMNKVLK